MLWEVWGLRGLMTSERKTVRIVQLRAGGQAGRPSFVLGPTVPLEPAPQLHELRKEPIGHII